MYKTLTEQIDEMMGVETAKQATPEPGVTLMESYAPEGVEGVETLGPAPKPTSDPFMKSIEAALIESGIDVDTELRRQYDPSKGNTQTHDWVSQRETLFGNEPYQFMCKRCLRWVHVNSDQTIKDAVDAQEIDPNCINEVINGVMMD